ncbi:MAG: hypothetical protein AAF747_09440 [Planctomycetota bacterium]
MSTHGTTTRMARLATRMAIGGILATAGQAWGQAGDPLAEIQRLIEGTGLANQVEGQLAGVEPVEEEETNEGGMRAITPDGEAPDIDGEVSIDENMIVELHVQDESLSNVLQMLSIQSQRNILASQDVAATVTANLYAVTFYEALDAILHVNGYDYEEQGNFIFVYTAEEMATRRQADRQRVAEVITLNFLTGVDAAEFVTPMLSEGGLIKTNGQTEVVDPNGEPPINGDGFSNEATMVVFDFPENIEAIRSIIDQLDVRPAQVLVEATIVQATVTEDNAFGVDFSLVSNLDLESFLNNGGPLGAVDSLITGTGSRFENGSPTDVPIPGGADNVGAVSSSVGNVSGPATIRVGFIDDDFAFFVRALDEVSDTTILSNPKILTLNRQPSRVLVGRKVGFLSTTATDTSTTQTVEFLDTGTQLYFRPFVTDEGLIRMELKPQVSEAIIREAVDATGAAVTIPDEITNEVVTNVIVPDGYTIILGGLFKESTTATRRQVPVLGDIPIIGSAFRGHEDATERTEIIFMIRPTIVSDAALISQGERAEDGVRQTRAGMRQGLLPFSRTRQAGQLLISAEELAAAGDTEGALHRVRRALALNPMMPDAIAMREKLLNKPEVWPQHSLLEQMVNDAMFGVESERGLSLQGMDLTPAFAPDVEVPATDTADAVATVTNEPVSAVGVATDAPTAATFNEFATTGAVSMEDVFGSTGFAAGGEVPTEVVDASSATSDDNEFVPVTEATPVFTETPTTVAVEEPTSVVTGSVVPIETGPVIESGVEVFVAETSDEVGVDPEFAELTQPVTEPVTDVVAEASADFNTTPIAQNESVDEVAQIIADFGLTDAEAQTLVLGELFTQLGDMYSAISIPTNEFITNVPLDFEGEDK